MIIPPSAAPLFYYYPLLLFYSSPGRSPHWRLMGGILYILSSLLSLASSLCALQWSAKTLALDQRGSESAGAISERANPATNQLRALEP